eukprot:TRINITY_DN7577_c0_g1_i2.p1 TRINITY_DN7577_c0_g1~~TRINITY_DN7577_c0_g1_i2.p1  ORF type:complete len:159 (+),score=40.39 TRINITY_DN7577_c0_g1_i2:92-568(+)
MSALERLQTERKAILKQKPLGFFAKPKKNADGTKNYFEWECGVPGKEGTSWQGGLYKLTMTFTEDYPMQPPFCKFTPSIFHPNVYYDGEVCLSILKTTDNGGNWSPDMSILKVLLGLQEFLDNPNNNDAAYYDAMVLYAQDKAAYKARILAQAKQFAP